jgi:tetratricopeptide (TPR) repeat protein
MRKLFLAVFGSVLLIIPVFLVALQGSSDREEEIEVHSRLARQYLQQKEPSLALVQFRDIVALDPDNVDARANLGVLLFYQGDFKAANLQLRAALRLQPALYKIQALLGMSERRTGEMGRARFDLETAFPKLTDNKIRVEAGLELIDIYRASDDLTKAADVVGVLRSLEPSNPFILYTAYQIYTEQTNEMLLATAVAAPDSAEMRRIMGDELARQGNRKGAIEQYRQALKLDPSLPGLHFELAELLYSSPDPALQAQAKAQYEAALHVNKFDAQAEDRLGEIAEKAGDLKEAALHYSRSLEIRPDDAEVMSSYAQVLLHQNQRKEAVALLERAIKLNPTSAKAHYQLGTLYRQMGKTAEAKQQLEEFMKYHNEKLRLQKLFRQMRLQSSTQSLSH